jgi:formate dehydrogenase maturation protein FdhE
VAHFTTLHKMMSPPGDDAKLCDRFGAIAQRFCSVVDSAPSIDRIDLLAQIYRILPKLIDEAISLPDVDLSDSDEQIEEIRDQQIEETGEATFSIKVRHSKQEWERLYNPLNEKLGDWNRYREVFDPTQDNEAIFGNLADDIADIYLDLKYGLVLKETHQAPLEDIIWEWRFSFNCHWGKHAMDALRTIHFRLPSTVY